MTLRIPANHPALPGHFPGNPIVPGVVILDHVLDVVRAQAGGYRIIGIRKLKFLFPLAPGQAFHVQCAAIKNNHVRFQCLSGETLVAEGNIQLAEIA